MYYLMDDSGQFYYINPRFNGFPFLEKEKTGYETREQAEYAVSELRDLCVGNRLHLDDVDEVAKIVDRLTVSTGLRRRRHLVNMA